MISSLVCIAVEVKLLNQKSNFTMSQTKWDVGKDYNSSELFKRFLSSLAAIFTLMSLQFRKQLNATEWSVLGVAWQPAMFALIELWFFSVVSYAACVACSAKHV